MVKPVLKSLNAVYGNLEVTERTQDYALGILETEKPLFPKWFSANEYKEALLGAIANQDDDSLKRIIGYLQATHNSKNLIREVLRLNRYRVFRAAVNIQNSASIRIIFDLALENGTDAFLNTMMTREYRGIGSHFSALTKTGQFETCNWIVSRLESVSKEYPTALQSCRSVKPEKHDYYRAFVRESALGNDETAAKIIKEAYAIEEIKETEIVRQVLMDQDFDLYHDACVGNPKLMRGLVKVAKIHLGEDFVAQMIAGQNYRGLRDAVSRDDKITALLILNALDHGNRQFALKHIPKNWEIFHQDRRIKKDELCQEIGGYNERWQIVLNTDAPHVSLQEQSPFKFSAKLYRKILPEIKAACRLEDAEDHAELIAYKLSVLFANTDEIDRYFSKYTKSWSEDREFSIVDATRFEIPQKGLWNVDHWKAIVLKNGPIAAQLLTAAPQVEKIARVLGQEMPSKVRAIRELKFFSEYDRAEENPRFAIEAAQYGISNSSFEDALDYMSLNSRSSDQMPDVLIDGDVLGHPEFYMVKLASDDPMQCLLGSINDHSMSIKNAAGQYTVPHIIGSQYAAAYVLKKKTEGQITDKDRIVVDSWAYITEQNNIVFDGIGSKESSTDSAGSISRFDRIFHRFLEGFAFDVVGNHAFSGADSNMRQSVESVSQEALRADFQTMYIQGVRIGDDKSWENELGSGTKQIACDSFGQFFNPQDKLSGWLHNESQDHQLIITPTPHEGIQEDIEGPFKCHEEALIKEAKAYIDRTTKKLEGLGINLQIGFELEAFAYDKKRKRRSGILEHDTVVKSLARVGVECKFEDENTDDKDGQYEIILPPLTAMEAAEQATIARQHLTDHAGEFGISHFNFDSVIEADEKNEAPIEPSSTHINLTAWDSHGNPLIKTSSNGNKLSPFTNAIIKGTLDVQSKLSVVFAQSAQDYKRFGYMSPAKQCRDSRHFAPTHIFAVTDWERTYEGPSLGVWNSKKTITSGHPETVRLENRMVGSNVNYYLALAGQIAAFEWAVDNYMHLIPPGNKTSSFSKSDYTIIDTGKAKLAVHKEFRCLDKKYTGWSGEGYGHRKGSCNLPYPQDIYAMPRNRTEALHGLAASGNRAFGRKRLGDSFYSALIQYHAPKAIHNKFYLHNE